MQYLSLIGPTRLFAAPERLNDAEEGAELADGAEKETEFID